jgi:TRAP-type C4-dicarboxylate transport system permease large subunit
LVVGVAFGLMGAFFMAGLYVAGALGVLSLALMYFFSNDPLWNIMASRAWDTHTNFLLVSIPLFILMGDLVLYSGIAERMYSAISRWVAFLPGGLIHTNIASCTVFSACASSSVATSATISRVSLPSFRARGYNERLVLGSLAAGGTLGILIPPSVPMVLYALIVGESVGRLFLAGFMPGLLLALVFMIMIVIVSLVWKGSAPREEIGGLLDMPGWRDRMIATVALVPIFTLIFLVLGSIYMGWATPSEAAGFGVAGALVLAVLNKSGSLVLAALLRGLNRLGVPLLLPSHWRARFQAMRSERLLASGQVREAVQVNLKMLQEAGLSTMRTTGMIFLILMAAFTLHFAFGYLRISIQMANWITPLDLSPLQLILILVLFYLVLGTFMESHAMMLTTLPILLPILKSAGIDLLWFGIVMVLLLEASLISPPEGINLYVLHGARGNVSPDGSTSGGPQGQVGTIADVWIGVLPFMACMGLVIGLIIAFPEIALWLPDQVKGSR